MTGTIINVGAVIAGSLVGLFLHARLPVKLTRIVFQGIGLFTLALGVSMTLKTEHFLIMIFSLVLGAIIGELIDIDKRIRGLGEYLKQRIGSDNDKFGEGLVSAFLLFCMGSMTILGAFEEGLGNEPNLLLAKSLLDGISSIALAAGLGIGVLFSVIPLFVYQGGLTLLAGWLQNVLNNPVVNELTAVGGLLLIGLGLDILEIKKMRILNMLPALVIAVLLAIVFLV